MKINRMAKFRETRLIIAGTIIFFIVATRALFQEFHIPGYWIPVIIGAVLIALGAFKKN